MSPGFRNGAAHTRFFWLFVRAPDVSEQIILSESLTFRSEPSSEQYHDAFGNITHRWTMLPGQTEVVHDALVQVSSLPDDSNFKKFSVPIGEITPETIRYTLPSRYCDSDKLLALAAPAVRLSHQRRRQGHCRLQLGAEKYQLCHLLRPT